MALIHYDVIDALDRGRNVALTAIASLWFEAHNHELLLQDIIAPQRSGMWYRNIRPPYPVPDRVPCGLP